MDKEDVAYIYIHTHTNTCVCIHTHTHTHTHTEEGYSAIKRMKFYHLQQHIWSWRALY